MARIQASHLVHTEKMRHSVHDAVPASYCSFSKANAKYVQIDTYGSPDREVQGVTSQTFQLDKNAAQKIIGILEKEFDLS